MIIGGGDGGVLREVVKHPEVVSVVMCEIDEVRLDHCWFSISIYSMHDNTPTCN